MSSAPLKLEDVSKFSKRSILLGHYQFSKYLQPHIGYFWRNKDYQFSGKLITLFSKYLSNGLQRSSLFIKTTYQTIAVPFGKAKKESDRDYAF